MDANLTYKTVKFEVYQNIGIPLNTERLDQTLVLGYNFARKNLMKKGDKIFSITYCVSFSLTNSHHSIEYKQNEKIYLPELFQDIGKIYFPKKERIEELPKRLSLSFREEEIIGKKEEIITKLQKLEEQKKTGEKDIYKELSKLHNQIKNLSIKLG